MNNLAPALSFPPGMGDSKPGNQAVLAVVECAADPALTETLLATERVAAAALVPFDNNLAMRRMRVS